MILSAPLPPAPLLNELAHAKQRLVAMRASLMQVCRDLEAQIQTLESLMPATPVTTEPAPTPPPAPATLFEAPPVNMEQRPASGIMPASSRVIEAAVPKALDPALEQATLEELNEALSRAFSQIASRSQW
jgi:hypothetical protein